MRSFLGRWCIEVLLDGLDDGKQPVLVVIEISATVELGVVDLLRGHVDDLKCPGCFLCCSALHGDALDVRFKNGLHLHEAAIVPSGPTIRDVNLGRWHVSNWFCFLDRALVFILFFQGRNEGFLTPTREHSASVGRDRVLRIEVRHLPHTQRTTKSCWALTRTVQKKY